jgi:hypothetical protein
VSPQRLSAWTRLGLASALIALALAGCGRGGDERTVGAVTQRFLRAVEAKDGAVACAQLTSAAEQQLESEEGERCSQAVTSVHASPSPVRRAAVYITSAKVDLTDGESAFLNRTSAGWKLSAVGCRPQAGKPADQPFACELEA